MELISVLIPLLLPPALLGAVLAMGRYEELVLPSDPLPVEDAAPTDDLSSGAVPSAVPPSEAGLPDAPPPVGTPGGALPSAEAGVAADEPSTGATVSGTGAAGPPLAPASTPAARRRHARGRRTARAARPCPAPAATPHGAEAEAPAGP
ncbi:hypothetical protein [Streptomyces sp. NPDC047928]|uniref:hypothetical protein n=1 Tax=unclassified Streptomyces TaxID=2593676 RepID=UPI00371A85DE